MPFTELDENTALIVIDLQRGIVGLPLAHPVTDVVARTVDLLSAFRERGLPVALVNVDGQPPGRTDNGVAGVDGYPDGWTVLVDELGQQPEDIVVTKQSRGAFATTDLAQRLRDRGVTQVVVTGIATGSGVESTARDAHEQGFHVSLPVDAMTDRSINAHEHSVRTVFPRIAETGTTDGLLALLATRR